MQAKAFRPDDDDDDDSDDDYSDDEELQSPIDEVDPFVFFVDTIKGKGHMTAALSLFFVLKKRNSLTMVSVDVKLFPFSSISK